ncbi:hypothetical protein HK104_003793 [Borealophlyctis nickersoniae]|nr:hypothetical protein HK104_003793 [Borealophlyctis nickersoniae]
MAPLSAIPRPLAEPTPKECNDGESATPNKLPRSSSRRGCTRSDAATIAVSLFIFLVCAAALIVGLGHFIVMRPEDQSGSYASILAGLGIGFALQTALFSILTFGRAVGQLWFAYRITSNGVSVTEMVASWSALYSASFRGMEGLMSGRSIIAWVLMVLSMGQIMLSAALGNLYLIQPFTTLKSEGKMLGMGPVTGDMPGFDQGNAVDTLLGSIGTIMVPLQKEAILPGPEAQLQATATCSADGSACEITRWGLANPLNMSRLHTARTKYSDWIPASSRPAESNVGANATSIPQFDKGDIIHANMTAYAVTVKCAPSTDLFARPNPWNPAEVWTLWTVPGVTPELQSAPGVLPSLHPTGPEFTAFTLVEASLGNLGQYLFSYITDKGEFYVTFMSRNYGNMNSSGFTYITDPIIGAKIGVAKCTVSARTGVVDTQLQLVYTAPTTVSKIISTSPPSFSTSSNTFLDSPVAGQVISRVMAQFNCVTWVCPTGDRMPWFAATTGIAPKVPETEEEERQIIGTAVAALADLVVLSLAAVSVPVPGKDVPYQVFSDSASSMFIITPSCAGVLIAGAVCSLLVSILYTVIALCNPLLTSGVRITDSIYTLLDYFQSPVVHNVGKQDGYREPMVVQRALRGCAMKLVERKKLGTDSWMLVAEDGGKIKNEAVDLPK